MSRPADRVRLVTYNVRRCLGPRGRHADPARVVRVLLHLAPDVVALQEVDSAGSDDVLGTLARATGLERVEGPTFRRASGSYGNGLLTRFPVTSVRRHDLSLAGREPRGALEVTLDARGTPLRVLVVHFGLGFAERAVQAEAVARRIAGTPSGWLVLAGDVNDWVPFGRIGRRFDRLLGRVPARATFPAPLPLVPLDRIWVRPRASLVRVRVGRVPSARSASDHRPLVADLDPPRTGSRGPFNSAEPSSARS